jgi:mRNA-degrading endonuclease toxin of MazEF toxin-antitoxin module
LSGEKGAPPKGSVGASGSVPAPTLERPPQFTPLPSKATLAGFSALTVHPGDVLWIEIPRNHIVGHEEADERPWVVISSNTIMHKRFQNLVIAVPFTSVLDLEGEFREARIRILKEHIHSTDSRFKQQDSLALTEHTRSLSLDRAVVNRVVGKISPKALNHIRAAVRQLLGLGSVPKTS